MITNILKQISELAIKAGDTDYSSEQIESNWLGTHPARIDEIEFAEEKLGIKLPKDYIDFLLITNGFTATNNCTEPRFEIVENIEYLAKIDDFIIEVWNQNGLEDIGKELARSILIGGIEEEQYFLLIPPESINDQWKYWKFASWIPGEYPFQNLQDYFSHVLDIMKRRMLR